MSLRPRLRFGQYRGHQLIEGPSVEPVTVQQLQYQLRLDDPEPLLYMYLTSAREQFEQVSGRALISQKWRLTMDRWPSQGGEPWWDGVRDGAIGDLRSYGKMSWVTFPRYRLRSVEEIRVFDDAGNSETVPVSDFVVDTQQEPGRMVLRTGRVWPVALQSANAIEIDYEAGYGNSLTDVPAALRIALLQFAAHLYQHRGDECSTEDAMRKSGAWSTFSRYMVRQL